MSEKATLQTQLLQTNVQLTWKVLVRQEGQVLLSPLFGDYKLSFKTMQNFTASSFTASELSFSAASCLAEQGEELVVLAVVNNNDPALPNFLKLLHCSKCMYHFAKSSFFLWFATTLVDDIFCCLAISPPLQNPLRPRWLKPNK